MANPKNRVRYYEPTPADRDWIPQQLKVAGDLVARYAGVTDWQTNQLDTLDEAYERWAQDPSGSKPHPDDVAEACGAVVGAFLARRLGLKWMVSEEGDRRMMVLWGRGRSGGDVVSSPVAIVNQRMKEGLTGFLAELAEGLQAQLAQLMAS